MAPGGPARGRTQYGDRALPRSRYRSSLSQSGGRGGGGVLRLLMLLILAVVAGGVLALGFIDVQPERRPVETIIPNERFQR